MTSQLNSPRKIVSSLLSSASSSSNNHDRTSSNNKLFQIYTTIKTTTTTIVMEVKRPTTTTFGSAGSSSSNSSINGNLFSRSRSQNQQLTKRLRLQYSIMIVTIISIVIFTCFSIIQYYYNGIPQYRGLFLLDYNNNQIPVIRQRDNYETYNYINNNDNNNSIHNSLLPSEHLQDQQQEQESYVDDDTAIEISPSIPSTITIDMISIGSISRMDYQIAQEQTFGRHIAVRNFYRINELNDTSDSDCSNKLKKKQLQSITKYCNQQWDDDTSTVRTWLRKRLKPFKYERASIGWLCAQKRPIDALQLIVQQYKHTSISLLPDYVVLIDDDTYINMDPFIKGLQYTSSSSLLSDTNSVLGSGCVFNFPPGLKFRYPHGGYGSIFSKDILVKLLRPIHCNNNYEMDGFTKLACWRLHEQNHFNELQYFTDGMSVLDLMYNYTKSLSFLQSNKWVNGDGFCFHSDQALGYFLGFYHIAIPDTELNNVVEVSDSIRMDSSYGYTEIGNGNNNDDIISGNSQCKNSYYEQCRRHDMICHYIQPNQMTKMYSNDTFYEDEIQAKIMQIKQSNESIAMDIISIGTLVKPYLQDAQERTFGSHPSVRHWFRITELNDTDATCYTNLTMDEVGMVYTKCKTLHDDLSNEAELVRRLLFKPKNHTGWMCAQKRPIDGLYDTIKQYKVNHNNNNNIIGSGDEHVSWSLPNYLLIVDDDTYLNMNYISDVLPILYPSDEAHVITGCRLVHPKRIQFTFPFGGYGTILTRRAIENFIRPIYCYKYPPQQSQYDTAFNAMACWRLEQNLFGEASYFSDGMSVLDLMYEYSSKQMYTNVKEWDTNHDPGFCFHSDHALGYFISFYHIVVPDSVWETIEYNQTQKQQTDVSDSYYLTDELRKKYTYTSLGRDGTSSSCKYSNVRKCTVDAPFCHYMDANHMINLYMTQMANAIM